MGFVGLDPLFAGETDIGQLGLIVARLGSVDEAAWPGARALPDYGKLRFLPAPPRPLAEALPDAPAPALDLLARLLRWNPGRALISSALVHCRDMHNETNTPELLCATWLI